MKKHEYDKILFRLIEIWRRLRNGEALVKKELAKEFNVSERTIQKDFNERLMSFLPIERIGKEYRVKKGYSLDKNLNFENELVINILESISSSMGKKMSQMSKNLFKKLFLFLKSHPKIDVSDTSYLYKNPPFGYLEQNDFINSVMIISTSFAPMELLNFLLYTEKKFNRKRSFKNAPRTLDLDIIMYNNIKLNNKRLNIPHPFFKQRDSVLLPLYLLRK